jgi:hypothetical protein
MITEGERLTGRRLRAVAEDAVRAKKPSFAAYPHSSSTPVRRNKSVRREDPDLLRAGALLYMARGKPRATVTTLLQVLRDLVLAFVAPRAVLVAENLLLRQQVIVLSRQVKRPRLRPFNRWVLA